MKNKENDPLTAFSTHSPYGSFNKHPTILQVIPALKSGGVEIETLEIATAILAAGGRPIIASAKGDLSKDPRTKGVILKILPLNTKNPLQIWRNAKLLKKLIRNEKVDIVHARSRGPAWSAFKAAKETGIPFITTYHAAYKSRSFFKTLYNSVMAAGDRVIAISPFIEQHIKTQYTRFRWFNPSKLRLIPRGIDLAYFNPKTVSSEQVTHLRQEWDLPLKARVILLPGRLSKSKGQDTLIKAFSLMKSPDTFLILLGSAQGHEAYRDTLLNLAASLNLENRVKWFPAISDLAPAYQLADVIVCPSHVPEGFGRLIVEAQAMEKLIIATHHGGACDLIEDGKTGWFVPPQDEKTLAKVLDQVLALPKKELAAMGKREREWAEAHFSKNVMLSETIAVYKEVISDN
ncbi:MAG: glycosyltransferase family 4 protein [Alphaproteobacteria bacterium]|nr:glycosyltransferase family 4 protein [Alphaproteobacteria bacterium]